MKDLISYLTEGLFKRNNKIPYEYYDYCIELLNLGLYNKSTGMVPNIKRYCDYNCYKITKQKLKSEFEELLKKFENAKSNNEKNIKLTSNEGIIFATWIAHLCGCWEKSCPEENIMKDIWLKYIEYGSAGESWFDDDSKYRYLQGWALSKEDIEYLKKNEPKLYKEWLNRINKGEYADGIYKSDALDDEDYTSSNHYDMHGHLGGKHYDMHGHWI